MAMKDETRWTQWKLTQQENPYSAAAATFAERWAECMDLRMALGASIAECAEEESHACAVVDGSSITGFQYHAALVQLILCWEHGEALREWHNAVNPTAPIPVWSGHALERDDPSATWMVVMVIAGASAPDVRWSVAPAIALSYWPSESLARSYSASVLVGECDQEWRIPVPLDGLPRDHESLMAHAHEIAAQHTSGVGK